MNQFPINAINPGRGVTREETVLSESSRDVRRGVEINYYHLRRRRVPKFSRH